MPSQTELFNAPRSKQRQAAGKGNGRKKTRSTAKGSGGWARTKTFDGKTYTLHESHTSKTSARAHAERLRKAPNPHRARITGSRGDWAVYARPVPKSEQAKPKSKAKRKAKSPRSSKPRKSRDRHPDDTPEIRRRRAAAKRAGKVYVEGYERRHTVPRKSKSTGRFQKSRSR